jgi:hypothetical protein
MLSFPTNVLLYLATKPVDLRRSYDGLSALVDGTFGKRAMSGDLFIFTNRRANQVRILFWDRDGYVIMMKRLEAGTFRRVKTPDGQDLVEIEAVADQRIDNDMCALSKLTKIAGLAREVSLDYATIAVVANHAAGRGDSTRAVPLDKIGEVLDQAMGRVRRIIEKFCEK